MDSSNNIISSPYGVTNILTPQRHGCFYYSIIIYFYGTFWAKSTFSFVPTIREPWITMNYKFLSLHCALDDGFDSSFFFSLLFWGLTWSSGDYVFRILRQANSTVLAINDFNIQKVGVPGTSCTANNNFRPIQ